MFKVFGRKKSSAPPPKSISISSPKAPTPTIGPRSSSLKPGDVTPLYAKFATRGESIDGLSAPPTLSGGPSTDDLRTEYMRSVTGANRVYGNESVTRFGSGVGLPGGASPTGSRSRLNSEATGDAPILVKKPATPMHTRQSTSSTSASGPISPSVRSQRQPSNDNEMLPPRAPALYTKQSSSSFDSKDGNSSDTSSALSNEPRSRRLSKLTGTNDVQKPRAVGEHANGLPSSNFRSNYDATPQPSNLYIAGASTISGNKDLPLPPPTTPPTINSNPIAKPEPQLPMVAPVSSTPKASSLVHPAFRRPQLSSLQSSTRLSSSLVHPSQRLRTTSNSISPTPPAMRSNPQQVTAITPSSEPPQNASKSSQVEVADDEDFTPIPDPQSIDSLSPSEPSPSFSEPTPPLPTTAASPPTALVAPEPPPSSFSDLLPEAVKKARRRSREFGTYDITAARRERESLIVMANGAVAVGAGDIMNDPDDVTLEPLPKPNSPVVKARRDEHGRLKLDTVDLPVRRPFASSAGSTEKNPTPRQNIPASEVRDAIPQGMLTDRASPGATSSPTTPRGHKQYGESGQGAGLGNTSSIAMTSSGIPHTNRNAGLFSESPTELRTRVPSTSTSKVSRPLPTPPNTCDTLNSSADGIRSLSSHSMSQSSSYSSNQSSGVFSTVTASTQHTTASFHRHSMRDAPNSELEQSASVPDRKGSRDAITEAQELTGQSPSTTTSAVNIRKKRFLPSPPTERHLLQSSLSMPPPPEASSRRRSSRAPVSSSTFDSLPQSASTFPPPQSLSPGGSRASKHVGESLSSTVSALPPLASGAVSSRVAQFQATLDQTHPEDPRYSTASALSMETVSPEPKFYPLERHLAHPQLLGTLLQWLTFKDLLPVFSLTAYTRNVMENHADIKEAILERFLTDSVGYLPKALTNQVRMMASSTRAYTKVVLRLRAQAEAEAATMPSVSGPEAGPDSNGRGRRGGRGKDKMPVTGPGTHPPTAIAPKIHSRRAPSPAFSFASASDRYGPSSIDPTFTSSPPAVSSTPGKFRSPLYKTGHAALLRVFVPSPEGAWLSDSSVIECERELKRASAVGLLRVGDVVHDLAAGDEANTGRLIWDGNYLIDLDYSYNPIGEIPRHIDSLAFPPAYFHKIVRNAGNPIVYIDLRPFAGDIADHLSLLQDRVQTETPQGSHHTVVRWIHRARFYVKPNTPVNPYRHLTERTMPMQFVDQGWFGSVVIEAEGTNEGLADLQTRVGNAVKLFAVKTLTSQRVSNESLRAHSAMAQPVGGGGEPTRRDLVAVRPGQGTNSVTMLNALMMDFATPY
ncbi:hypothetical protein FRB97_005615 [Tulasnella sp. 331]|nr:hypothetical protein FRB97_005615 [Tulasnella sp. 331]